MVQILIYDHCDNLPSSGLALVVLCRYLSTVNTDKGLVSLVRTPVAPPETLQQCVGYTVLAAVLFCGG